MRVIGSARGAFKKVSIKASASIVNIDEFKGKMPGSSFVQTFTVGKAEKIGMLQCFNGVNHIYAFGHDPEGSVYSCTMLVFMNKACDPYTFESSKSLAELVGAYNNLRVSQSKKTVTMQIDDGHQIVGILVGMNARVEDPELNLVSVTFMFRETGK